MSSAASGAMLTSTKLEGTVLSGEGVGASFIRLPWVRDQIKKKFGFYPYPGTLNLHLEYGVAVSLRDKLQGTIGLEIKPRRGFYKAHCYHVMISSNVNGCVLIPEKPDYPMNILEVVAEEQLRSMLSLADGDRVELTFILKPIKF